MHARCVISLLALAAAAAAGGVDFPDDAPVASRPSAGDVTGAITPAGKVQRLHAVSRVTGKVHAPASFDRTSGEFRFADLAGDATYDLVVTLPDGRRIEGIDLGWHEARMLRLAELRRRQLRLVPKRPRDFRQDDVDELLKYVKDLRDFADVRRALYVQGHGKRATMLVEVMRVRDFYAKKGGQLIWRTELWYFINRYGGWERVGNVERVLERHRIEKSAWEKITLIYDPALSVTIDEEGASKPVKFRVPVDLDPSRGRLAGTPPVQTTKPIILGVTKEEPSSTTQPAPQK